MKSAAVADIGLVEGGGSWGLSRRKPLQGESYRELANKLASNGVGWGWEGWGFI